MALLEILRFPDDRLRVKARPVTNFDGQLESFAQDMLATMYHAGGIGLAAVQVNRPQRVIVVDLSETREEPRIFVNPELHPVGEEYCDTEEGCLSVPDMRATVRRHARVWVQAQDVQGRSFRTEAEGMLAVCLQHELDHLEGKLFIDYLSPLKRERLRQRLEKERRAEAA